MKGHYDVGHISNNRPASLMQTFRTWEDGEICRDLRHVGMTSIARSITARESAEGHANKAEPPRNRGSRPRFGSGLSLQCPQHNPAVMKNENCPLKSGPVERIKMGYFQNEKACCLRETAVAITGTIVRNKPIDPS